MIPKCVSYLFILGGRVNGKRRGETNTNQQRKETGKGGGRMLMTEFHPQWVPQHPFTRQRRCRILLPVRPNRSPCLVGRSIDRLYFCSINFSSMDHTPNPRTYLFPASWRDPKPLSGLRTIHEQHCKRRENKRKFNENVRKTVVGLCMYTYAPYLPDSHGYT
jgi:hypothetical protein